MGRTSIRDENTKEKLIDSAMELFMKKGYAKTTLEDIVRNVGLTRGAFYWNYKEKRDLLLEIEKRYSYIIQSLFQIEQLPSAYESLKNMITKNLDERINHPSAFLYFIRYRIEAETELSDLISQQRSLDAAVLEEIGKQLSRGIESGEFCENLNVKREAFYIYTNLIGVGTFTTTHMGSGEGPSLSCIPDNLEEYADFILQNIKNGN